jgi:hypothetical protein
VDPAPIVPSIPGLNLVCRVYFSVLGRLIDSGPRWNVCRKHRVGRLPYRWDIGPWGQITQLAALGVKKRFACIVHQGSLPPVSVSRTSFFWSRESQKTA